MIYIAGDKYGFKTIQSVKKYLEDTHRAFKDLGCHRDDEDMDLELMIPPIVEAVIKDESNVGILSCGTGIGVEVGANKFGHIRACLATNEKLAEWAITYDKCNVLCLPGWEMTETEICKILAAWFNASYDGSKRRLKMFDAFKDWH